MASQRLISERLDELCSRDQIDLLNTVDSLRSQDIRHFISLPQIIVCGDQSSGKSSVLQAISGVSFPFKSDTGTRFPTELILRKSDQASINISISPHTSRTESEKKRLEGFKLDISTFEDAHRYIEKAANVMGVNSSGKGFSNDILRIEVSGPDKPYLTVVDLPGLIHSPSKSETPEDIQMIHDLVKSYMNEPRSIILAIVSAKNDYKNQIVLRLAQDADTSGARTLGVITKLDTLPRNSGSEETYLNLARNAHVELQLGWHVLCNQDTEIDGTGSTLAQRDMKEDKFFSATAWSTLSPHQLGIETFRTRLSDLLLRQISAELPSLMRDIVEETNRAQLELERLGKPRFSISEQRFYLRQLSQDFRTLVQAARDGTYDHSFFGDAMTDDGYSNRIRAVVHNLNRDFAKNLQANGQRYRIVDYVARKQDYDNDGTSQVVQETLTRDQYVSRIMKLLERTRGRELTGLFNPMIVDTLFKEQSSPWESMAWHHVREVVAAARRFVQHVIDYIADKQTADGLLKELIGPKMEIISQAVHSELARLLEPHCIGHPITYNHYLTDTLQKIRAEREKHRVETMLSALFDRHISGWDFRHELSQEQIQEILTTSEPERDSDHFAASEALDYMTAYYQVARKRFVDDLAIGVIERSVMNKLQDMFSTEDVETMSQFTVAKIAGETMEGRQTRESLAKKIEVLRDGLETYRRFADSRLKDDVAASKDARGGADHQLNGNINGSAEFTPSSFTDSKASKAPQSPISPRYGPNSPVGPLSPAQEVSPATGNGNDSPYFPQSPQDDPPESRRSKKKKKNLPTPVYVGFAEE